MSGNGADLITVLMPLKHYHPIYLRRALDSIRSQECPAWRLAVIVEPEDLRRFRSLLRADLGDSRVALMTNGGRRLAGAVNTGMRWTRSPFVALLLADDMWLPRAVAVLRAHITAHPAIDFFHSARVVIDGDDAPISPVYRGRSTIDLREFRWGSPVKHLLCWRRELGLSIGGLDESLGAIGVDDYDFPWTMAQAGARFEAIDDCLYRYRNHCDGYRLTTHTPRSTHMRELDRILAKHGVGWLGRALIRLRRRRGTVGAQCLYRSPLHRWLTERLGIDRRRHWRQPRYQEAPGPAALPPSSGHRVSGGRR
jgi:glycosyltransferase involved in cell wall biosynthesis